MLLRVSAALGGAGIILAGYGPGTKDVNRKNEFLRNHLHHIGELHWHTAATGVWQSGENRVAYNLIHDTNYTAITVSGRINWNREGRGDGWATIRWKEVEAAGGATLLPEPGKPRPTWEQRAPFLHGRNNLVKRNEIHDVMQRLWDGDAIYVSGTGAGNRIRENFIRDCLPQNMCEAIRCDDDQHDTTIDRRRARRRRDHPAQHPGRDETETETVFLKNVLGVPPDPKFSETKTDRDLCWHSEDPTWTDAHFAAARAKGQEQHSRFADPRFVNPDAGDFRFQPGSPAPALGIEPIDLRKV